MKLDSYIWVYERHWARSLRTNTSQETSSGRAEEEEGRESLPPAAEVGSLFSPMPAGWVTDGDFRGKNKPQRVFQIMRRFLPLASSVLEQDRK